MYELHQEIVEAIREYDSNYSKLYSCIKDLVQKYKENINISAPSEEIGFIDGNERTPLEIVVELLIASRSELHLYNISYASPQLNFNAGIPTSKQAIIDLLLENNAKANIGERILSNLMRPAAADFKTYITFMAKTIENHQYIDKTYLKFASMKKPVYIEYMTEVIKGFAYRTKKPEEVHNLMKFTSKIVTKLLSNNTLVFNTDDTAVPKNGLAGCSSNQVKNVNYYKNCYKELAKHFAKVTAIKNDEPNIKIVFSEILMLCKDFKIKVNDIEGSQLFPRMDATLTAHIGKYLVYALYADENDSYPIKAIGETINPTNTDLLS